jgi:hypothetical protein
MLSNMEIFFTDRTLTALLRAYLPTAYPDAIAKANFWEFLVFIAMGKYSLDIRLLKFIVRDSKYSIDFNFGSGVAGGALSAVFIFVNSKWIKFRREYAKYYPILK